MTLTQDQPNWCRRQKVERGTVHTTHGDIALYLTAPAGRWKRTQHPWKLTPMTQLSGELVEFKILYLPYAVLRFLAILQKDSDSMVQQHLLCVCFP